MRSIRYDDALSQIDLEPGGYRDLVSVYLAESKGKAVLIESGPAITADELAGLVRNASITHVIVTHVHIDHGGGAGGLIRRFPATIYAHPRATKVIQNPDLIWEPARMAMGWLGELYGKPFDAPRDRVRETSDGEVITVGDLSFKVIHTPGHASHHQSILMEPGRVLFLGDAAGIYLADVDYVIPTTMSPIRLDLYVDSIKKLIRENPSKLAYTHFGIVGNAVERLEDHLTQVESWIKALSESLAEKSDAEEILIERDYRLRQVIDKIRERKAHYHLFKMAVEGMVSAISQSSENLPK
ncbi:MBL fold metallo-hydrolase [Thermocladium modestius]|uniref:MBL fold metallo-hydrolase n=1 Tax=Thermocladium modestius TaxID=62609 RepID=A0A830GUB4_9CREN|nr:MBL fold metallo-hydrolase [Thermocladium modestius]GGP20046.1 MBL fold metallo-hydrolase [Thermocladium modestius]